MSDKTKKEVYATDYMTLFDDGTIGLDDGVGYLDTLDKEKVFKLYMALKKLIEDNKKKDEKVMNKITKGWECPKCGRCYPIWITECPHCKPKPKTVKIKWE